MKALEEKIRREGSVLPGNILKVGSFLNHQVDAEFTMEMGREIARLFAQEKITRVLTIETSGIPIALAAAAALHVPMVFAKKNRTGNLSGELYQTVVHSYTHGTDYNVVVEKKYILPGDRVLIVDDFLANGKALLGLMELVRMAGAETAGAAVAIEKGFQRGGDALRQGGMRVESLAIIESMEDGNIVFRD
ncbi:MAG: xanthine phosphoribosyltransferase [Oscillospiraceae bacterium]|nr:xanthine phosphoribosyltransferase [Oscillospiraceae bacterium]